VPALVTLFAVELLTSALVTWVGVAPGLFARCSAATPATCDAAIEVPLMVLVAEVMLVPGATMSRQLPKFEKLERASLFWVEPTVIATGARAGE
jgi:hypothetical protein